MFILIKILFSKLFYYELTRFKLGLITKDDLPDSLQAYTHTPTDTYNNTTIKKT